MPDLGLQALDLGVLALVLCLARFNGGRLPLDALGLPLNSLLEFVVGFVLHLFKADYPDHFAPVAPVVDQTLGQ